MRAGEDYVGVGVVYFCHDGNGRILLNKRSSNCRDEHGRWDPGGGEVKHGDTIEDTIRREIREEYCADALNIEYLGYRDVHRIHNDTPTHWIMLDFKVLVNPLQVENGEPHKFDDLKWFAWNHLPTPLHSQLPRTMELYKDKL